MDAAREEMPKRMQGGEGVGGGVRSYMGEKGWMLLEWECGSAGGADFTLDWLLSSKGLTFCLVDTQY